MSRFREILAAGAAYVLLAASAAAAADAVAGEKVFAKCKACHAVGEGARNRVGPHLNHLIGRTAGSVDGYKYSPAMVTAGTDGLIWTGESLAPFLANPRGALKGTRMTFAGIKDDAQRADVIAYLATFSEGIATAPAGGDVAAAAPPPAAPPAPETSGRDTTDAAPESSGEAGAGLNLKLGRRATEEEVAAWDIDVRPDGLGLPEGRGTVAEGMEVYDQNCASCHGDFGEAIDRWPVLAGGQDTLTDDRPVKSVGSYWPYLSTVYDYVHRAMPFGNSRSLTNDEVYAVTAYILYLNDIVTEEDFELSKESFGSVQMPNEGGFVDDDREAEPHYAADAEPCMSECAPDPARIKMHAAVLDVTPEDSGEDEPPAAGID